jgi:UDP-glucuronate decarboxylase
VNLPFISDIDVIFNLASPASPLHYQRDPIYTIKTNVIGTSNLLDLALSKDAVFIQASTSEIYGDPEVSPQDESYWGKVNPIGIRSCYDEGKRSAETIIMDFNRQFDLDTRIARIFNTYGPFMAANDGRVVSNLITQALRNQDLTVFGDGNQIRSFCYVDDLIEGLIAMLSNDRHPGPINLGNPEPISMNKLAQEVLSISGSMSKISYQKIPQDDPRTRTPDIKRANDHLNWFPKVGREEGLARTIEYFREIL